MIGDSFFLGTHRPGWLARLDVPLFVSHRTLRTWPRLPWAREPWALDSGGLIGPPSGPQIAALLTRWVHRQERLVQPTNLTAPGVAVWVGLHQLPARAVVRGLRVVTRVDRHHHIQHGLQRDRAGHVNQLAPVNASVQQPLCRRQPIQGIWSRPRVDGVAPQAPQDQEPSLLRDSFTDLGAGPRFSVLGPQCRQPITQPQRSGSVALVQRPQPLVPRRPGNHPGSMTELAPGRISNPLIPALQPSVVQRSPRYALVWRTRLLAGLDGPRQLRLGGGAG
jgi:hypothetical protein